MELEKPFAIVANLFAATDGSADSKDHARDLLKRLRGDVLDPAIARHGGRVLRTDEEVLLVRFDSALQAFQSAVDMQTGFDQWAARSSGAAGWCQRIGVHAAPLAGAASDGEAGEVAVRLGRQAQPGTILLSESAHREMRLHSQATFSEVNERQCAGAADDIRMFQADMPFASKPLEFVFDTFRLIPAQHILLDGNEKVRLGGRAFDILVALVERPGAILSKEELTRRVWPDTRVEDGTLKVHVSALRRALRDGQDGRRLITNVSGRGYSFVLPVRGHGPDEPKAVASAAPSAPKPSFATPLARMVGRSETVETLVAQVLRQRLVTIVGAGGIGKTTVAVAVADKLRDAFHDGVYFVDLSPLASSALVRGALASAFGVGAGGGDPLASAMGFLQSRQVLIVIDNCEHVIDATAALVEDVLRTAPRVHILTTSREALRAQGEQVHRLPSLAFPNMEVGLSAKTALTYSAVELFAERAAASLNDFQLTDADAPIASDLCRRLDGNALAIEIVAGWVDTFGLSGLATMLDERFRLGLRGRRTALPRHRTLYTTIDWSYSLLPELEQTVLRRLAVFAGRFSLESLRVIVADDVISPYKVIEASSDLVAKSLVAVSVEGGISSYRLLDTTRGFAAIKLEESGETQVVNRRHAQHYTAMMTKAYEAWSSEPAVSWLEQHRSAIDDVRAALEWAFSPSGDAEIGVELAVAAVPLWFHAGLTRECAEQVDRALAAPSGKRSPQNDMRLHAARAWSLMQTKSLAGETLEAWARVLDAAREQRDSDFELRALWGLWAGLLNNGELSQALILAREFFQIASAADDALGVSVGDRMIGYIQHLLGEHEDARRHLVKMLTSYEVPVIGAQMIRFVFDQRATALCFLARIHFVQGRPKQAVSIVFDILNNNDIQNDILTLCQVLVQGACPVALLVGDLELAAEYADMLSTISTHQGLTFWSRWGRAFRSVLLIKRGLVEEGLAELKAALADLRSMQFGVFYIFFMSELAAGLALAGKPAEGLAAIEEAHARSERNNERWYSPEILRIKGDLMAIAGTPEGTIDAEAAYRSSLDLARAQGALSWELRSSISLANLLRMTGRTSEAWELLSPVRQRFPQDASSQDLTSADELLRALGREDRLTARGA